MTEAALEAPRAGAARSGNLLVLFAAAVATPLVVLVGSAILGLPGRFNDFSSYWLAGRLLEQGANPYDLARLDALAHREHVDFLLGTGYSYPLPFAVAVVPLSRLPFDVAAWLFVLVTLAAFGAAVAVWLLAMPLPPGPARPVLALAAGFYPPVAQSAFYGQANLLVVALLALGLLPLARSAVGAGRMDGRLRSGSLSAALVSFGAGACVGLAGLIKLVPLTLAVPLALGRRAALVGGMLAASAVALVVAALAFPAASGMGSLVTQLFSPDVFWTNQSINGFASRLVEPSDRTVPLAHGVPAGALVTVLTAALAGAVVLALWRARRILREGGPLCLATAVVLVAAVAGAPKDSFWNHAQVVVAAGLLLAASSPRSAASSGALPRAVIVLVVTWYGAAVVQNLLDQSHGSVTLSLGPVGSVVSSTAFLGLLALFGAAWLSLETAAARTHARPIGAEPG